MNVFATRPEWKAFLLALAGSVVLIVGMGYGRFAYTGILPLMLNEQLLTLREGNLAASANYAGYLAGALLLAALSEWPDARGTGVDASVAASGASAASASSKRPPSTATFSARSSGDAPRSIEARNSPIAPSIRPISVASRAVSVGSIGSNPSR